MRNLIATLITAFLVLPCTGQSDLATIYEMTPRIGHVSATMEALAEHSAWRAENGDPWNWDIFQVVSGDKYGTFYARSGQHMWADFDSYALDGALQHFEQTVSPHLASESNIMTSGDTTHVNMPEWGAEAPYYWLVDYYIVPGEYETFMKAVGLFHEAITESGHPSYYYFAGVVTGGDGVDVQLAMPAQSMADFAPAEGESMDEMLNDYFKEVGMDAIQEMFSKSVEDTRSRIIVRRDDLSVN